MKKFILHYKDIDNELHVQIFTVKDLNELEESLNTYFGIDVSPDMMMKWDVQLWEIKNELKIQQVFKVAQK